MPQEAERDERCGHCKAGLAGDITIRCPICRTPHHLGCYAEQRGCAVFGCVRPPEEVNESRPPRSAAQLAEELYRAELRSAKHRWTLQDEGPITLALLGLFVAFMIFILLVV